MSKYNDLTGQKFGRLTAIEPIRKSGRISWICECECGNTKQILAINLTKRKKTTPKYSLESGPYTLVKTL